MRDVQVYAGVAAPFNFNGLVRHYFLRQGPDRRRRAGEPPLPRRSARRRATPWRVRLRPHGRGGGPALRRERQGGGDSARSAGARHAHRRSVRPDAGGAARRGRAGAERLRLGAGRGGRGLVAPGASTPSCSLARRCRMPRRSPGSRRREVARAMTRGGRRAPPGYAARPCAADPVSIVLRFAAVDRAGRRGRTRACGSPPAPARWCPRRRVAVLEERGRAAAALPQGPQAGGVRHGRRGPGAGVARPTRCSRWRTPLAGRGDRDHAGPARDELTERVSLNWDGEWRITYEVFRDLGIAFAAVLVLIYLLVVAWFQSFRMPLVIMAPIPLTLVGHPAGALAERGVLHRDLDDRDDRPRRDHRAQLDSAGGLRRAGAGRGAVHCARRWSRRAWSARARSCSPRRPWWSAAP